MRNNTITLSKSATAEEILGKRNGSTMGPPQTNKKPIVRRSRLEKANVFYENETYGRLTGLTVAARILQNYLVFSSIKFPKWKEPGISTITIKVGHWIDNGELPTIIARHGLSDAGAKISVQDGSRLVNVDAIRTKLLNLENWDLKVNVPEWEKHKIKRGRRVKSRKPNSPINTNGYSVYPKDHWIIKFIKFIMPWTR